MTPQASIHEIPLRAAVASDGWLVGGGAMATVIKAMDWSRTALGPIESWSQSLRTIVSMAQASNSPMSLVWGVGHVQIYNDGYWPICGTKHPSAMGQDFRECWATAWPVIGEAYASAWAGKSAYLEKMRMFLDRHGFLEETWFTFSFSPITDESGGVGGVFHPVTEMTTQMLSERRTRIMRDLASRTSGAQTSEEAFALTTQVMAEADLDIPFFLLYVMDGASGVAKLVGHAGLKPATPHGADLVFMRAVDDQLWAIGEVARTGQAKFLVDVESRLAGLSVGAYPELPKMALVLPIMQPGSTIPAAVVVMGLSARQPMTEVYRGFYDLLAAGVATALASARAYEEERTKTEALAQLDRAKTAFFSNVSHEFRTPLALILGPIEQALAHGNLEGENLQVVHRSALRLLRLVNTLLDFSRIEAAGLQSSFEPTDISALTAGVAGSFDTLLASGGVELVVDCPPGAEPVYLDRGHWETIVLNLLSNAFKFTFAGKIAVRLRTVERRVELSVSDTGAGIPADELPKIFDRFHRVEGARGRSFEGTGIGLALVSELVKAHGGNVHAESIVGSGTTFVVSIPFGSSHLPPEKVSSEQRSMPATWSNDPVVLEAARWVATASPQPFRTASTASDREAHRVLVVDDNPDMREYLGRLLAPHWNVDLISDGQAALDAAIAHPPDLILSDVMMPGMDGVALVRALRGNPRTAPIPVVLLSARAGEEAVLEGLETLADDYLVKPFSSRELLTRVRTHLRMAQVRQKLQAQLAVAARMSAVGTLAAGVAHEINNPLAYVMANLVLIGEEIRALAGDSPSGRMKDLAEMLAEASQGAERVRKIVQGMKTFSRIEDERIAVTDLLAVLELSINMAFNEIRHRAQLVKDFGKIPLVDADDARLGQVFINLLVNAAQALPEGNSDSNEIRIVTSTDAMGQAVVEVRDTGPGIPPEILARIFDPFFTTKPAGVGTGLGLAICHNIVTGMGGQITVTSQTGRGTSVRVVLPASRSGVLLGSAAAIPQPQAGSPRRANVLVLDDERSVGLVVTRVLRDHHVKTATTALEALGLIEAGSDFDVILSDIMMPGTSGMEFYAALARQYPKLASRVVFVTGGAFTNEASKFLDGVANERLEKPFDIPLLRATIQTFLK